MKRSDTEDENGDSSEFVTMPIESSVSPIGSIHRSSYSGKMVTMRISMGFWVLSYVTYFVALGRRNDGNHWVVRRVLIIYRYSLKSFYRQKGRV